MKLTNRQGLPDAIVQAVSNDPYTRGDANISVTALLGPPQIRLLKEKHEDEVTEDVSDRIWSLFGQVVHGILERANRTGIAERRLSIEVEGWRVSGGMDLVHQGDVLADYKTCSVYSIKDGVKPEWIQQLNCYAAILRANGEKVSALEIVAIIRDWSKMEASRDPYYPQAQVVRMEVPLWSEERAQAFLRERVILHKQASLSNSTCSPEERWAKPDVWAVMKKGRKTALKLHLNEADARAQVGFDKELSVVYRPGVSTRCVHYCAVSRFCPQYQALTSVAGPAAEDQVTEPAAVEG